MTTFPGSPRLFKGAIVSIDQSTSLPSIILFQYNPETMTRKLEARAAGGDGGSRSEVFRLSGPPKETITLKIELDVADQLERGEPQAIALGIYPAIAALELLLYPKSTDIVFNAALAQFGNIEIVPPEGPLTFFVWGPARVLPVRITSFSVTEHAYDPALNPMRAEIDLSLQVLSYADFQASHVGSQIFLAHQIIKELMPFANLASSAINVGASLNIL